MNKDDVYKILNEAYFSESSHEKNTLKKIAPLLQKASLFVDAGASLGQYTKLANECMQGGTIISIEADPIRYEELERNARQWEKGSKNIIKVIHGALTDVAGPVTFHTTESNVSGGLFPHDVEGKDVTWKTTTVIGVTLDDICAERAPDLIKMDIEGGELRALRGGARMLANDSIRTQLLIEVHEWPDPAGQKNPKEVFSYMKSIGYFAYPVGGSFFFDRGLSAAVRSYIGFVKMIPQKVAAKLMKGK